MLQSQIAILTSNMKLEFFQGVYNEIDLVPPKYTHTYGLFPDSVTVTGVGIVDVEKSVFDIINISKLSNMTIIATENMRYASSF